MGRDPIGYSWVGGPIRGQGPVVEIGVRGPMLNVGGLGSNGATCVGGPTKDTCVRGPTEDTCVRGSTEDVGVRDRLSPRSELVRLGSRPYWGYLGPWSGRKSESEVSLWCVGRRPCRGYLGHRSGRGRGLIGSEVI